MVGDAHERAVDMAIVAECDAVGVGAGGQRDRAGARQPDLIAKGLRQSCAGGRDNRAARIEDFDDSGRCSVTTRSCFAVCEVRTEQDRVGGCKREALEQRARTRNIHILVA